MSEEAPTPPVADGVVGPASAPTTAPVFATFSDGASVPASEVANQVGAFATQNRAAPKSVPRPALAPASPAIIDKLKGWAVAALGGGKLQLPSAPTTSSSSKAGELGASPYLEVYVRQMACRKPDCVPLETVFMLLGNGWHEKTEVLFAADEVTQVQVGEAASLLWERALERQAREASSGAGAGAAAAAAAAAAVAAADGEATPGVGNGGGGGASLAEVEADLFTKKTVEAVAMTFGGGGGDGARGANDGGAPGAAGGASSLLGSGSGDIPVVLPRDITEYAFSEDEVYVVGTNGRKVTVIAGLEHLAPTLKELVLRSHVISRMEGLRTLVHLTKLELYDNNIEALEELECLPQLTVLDMSYNSIRSMAPVRHCPLLGEIYLAQNKLRAVEGLEGLVKLRKIDLGGNRIRELNGVAKCVALEELWAGKNKVERLDNCLGELTALKRLDVQSNRLVSVKGLVTSAQAHTLEELYLARNGIASLLLTPEEQQQEEGPDTITTAVAPLGILQALNTVDVSNNRLTTLEGLGQCSALEEVWASSNMVEDLAKGVQDLLVVVPVADTKPVGGEGAPPSSSSSSSASSSPSCSKLTCVYLEHNPCAQALGEANYRAQLKALLPGLTQIDANPA